MAIIYSYPAIDEIASSDLMLISDASKKNVTKSTSISQLTSYISGIIGTGDVSSVNTQTGVVVLDTDDIAQGTTNLYMTFGTTSTTALVGTTFNSVTNDGLVDMFLIKITQEDLCLQKYIKTLVVVK